MEGDLVAVRFRPHGPFRRVRSPVLLGKLPCGTGKPRPGRFGKSASRMGTCCRWILAQPTRVLPPATGTATASLTRDSGSA